MASQGRRILHRQSGGDAPAASRGAAFMSGGLVAIIAGIFGLGDLPKDYSNAAHQQCEIAAQVVGDEAPNLDVPEALRREAATAAARRLEDCLEEDPWTFFGLS